MRPRTAAALPLLAGFLAGCELQEVTTTVPADLVVAEAVLWAGRGYQTVFLHRSLGGGRSAVPDAAVRVVSASGAVLDFEPTDLLGVCVLPGEEEGTCYVAADLGPEAVAPGESYRLEVELADGGRLTARTTVPGDFHILTPSTTTPSGNCTVSPGELLELRWTRAPGSWVYVIEADFGASLRQAFPDLDIPAPFRTLGLSVGSSDTTLVFPAEVGLFDRFDEDATEVLAALQGGMPPRTDAAVVVAAADRNYVNWVRGGTFNPSGTVRIASVEGDGTGVFGALVVRDFHVYARSADPSFPIPACTS